MATQSPATIQAHVVVLETLVAAEIAATVRAIREDLSVGTSTDGRGIHRDRTRITRLLDTAGQRYLDACRVLTAVRKEQSSRAHEADVEMAGFRAEAVKAIRAESKSKAAPQRWAVDDWVVLHRETQVRRIQEMTVEIESARREAEALVRACDPASREATLRRLLDETR